RSYERPAPARTLPASGVHTCDLPAREPDSPTFKPSYKAAVRRLTRTIVRVSAPRRLVAALRDSEEALVAGVPPGTQPCMSTPAASRDPGVLACSEHGLPGADGDAVVPAVAVPVVPQVDPLSPLS